MRTCTLCCILAVSFLIFFARQSVSGELYKYTDERGVVHYTNVPTDKRCKEVKYAASSGQPRLTISTTPGAYSIDRQTLRFGRKQYRSSFDHHIQHAAHVHKVDPMLIKAIIKTESNFNRYAVSSKGAQGLMQLMPTTAKYLNVHDPFDPWQNIYGGTRYIKELLQSFNGDLRLSIAAYNAGPTRVMKTNAVPRIPETVAYVGKVIRQYQAYRKGGNYFPFKTSIRVRQLVTVN